MKESERWACRQCGGIEFVEKVGITLRRSGLVFTLPNIRTHECQQCGYETLRQEDVNKIWALARAVKPEEDN